MREMRCQQAAIQGERGHDRRAQGREQLLLEWEELREASW